MELQDESRPGRRSPYRFTQVPHWALLMTDLSDAGYRVYSLLLSYVNSAQDDGKAWPLQKTMAEMLGRRREAVGRVIREELEPLGLVTVEKERYGTNDIRHRNIYYVHEEPLAEADVYASLADWRKRNGKTAGQDGGAKNRSSEGGAEIRSSRRAENRSSGRAKNRSENYTYEERDSGGTTHAATAPKDGAAAPGEGVQGWSPEETETRIAELCRLLVDQVKANGAKPPRITYAWKNAARDLLSGEDPYTYEQVRDGIRWAQADNFWASRTTTMAKLAKHFDQIIIRARKDQQDTSTPQGKQAQQDLMSRRLEAMQKFMDLFEERSGRPMNDSEREKLKARVKEEIQ